MLDRLQIDQPRWKELTSIVEINGFVNEVGFPVLIRPSYVLSGAAMNVVSNKEELEHFLNLAARVSKQYPVVVSEFIQQAKENYDIILVDSSEPVGPSVSLHEKKFYQRLRDNLSQPGIVVAQMGSPFFHQDELFRKFEFLRTIFKKVFFYTGPVPTYPAGEWSYAFLSETIDPTQILREPPGGLKYYSPQAHQRAFLLPKPLEKLRQDLS